MASGDGMNETAIDLQRYSGSGGVRSERELVAKKDHDPVPSGGAVGFHRHSLGRGCSGIECG
ncbi:hypothetical protein W59_36578 [Rhodococcus opacus RKJ300 = JCM 13270]|uniref:Uncharacterized protein n=1 Tax=Rhodococcus opacus RKJ300 = JCM 13270 TaxID=1165867 RepID=I0W8Y0_RHOOP|nr:hypothetical protein W59_36578 [Rhodococcus opacus RKJ300 = JCM 13270]